MESIFLNEGDRAAFVQHISHSFACTFICFWSYLPPPSNCLILIDGVYLEENIKQQIASSSSGTSLARRLFYEYQKSVFNLDDNGRVPGVAFKNSIPYIEFNELELQPLASTQIQLQFYQEARIKKVVFMGCNLGEIEIGMSIDTQLVDLQTEMRNWFPKDFAKEATLESSKEEVIPQTTDQNLLSSSSSSLRSLSNIDSPEVSPFLYNITSSTSYNINPQQPMPCTLDQSPIIMPPQVAVVPINTISNPFQEAIQTLSQIRNVQFPSIESEDDAMTRAILAVISASSSSTASSTTSSSHVHQPQQQIIRRPSAFKRYIRSSLSPRGGQIIGGRSSVTPKQNILKRAIAFITSSSLSQLQEQVQIIRGGIRSTSSQSLQHMIAERRRREKINESFQALRSLLPPGSKKDKASVLSNTTEYMRSLKAQVEELTKTNQTLEQQLIKVTTTTQQSSTSMMSSTESWLQVQITNINPDETTSSSDARMLDLRVTVRGGGGGGGESSLTDLAVRVLEFLKTLGNVRVLSIQGDMTRMEEGTSVSQLVWRLMIQGGEWDQVTFQEAVRRLIADMPQ